MGKYLNGFLIGVIFALGSSTYLFWSKYSKVNIQLISITEASEALEKQLENEAREFKRKEEEFKSKLEAADEKRTNDINTARADFIAERLRLQADNQNYREASDVLSSSLGACTEDRAETERILLFTLDQAELINAAYSSCRSSLLER